VIPAAGDGRADAARRRDVDARERDRVAAALDRAEEAAEAALLASAGLGPRAMTALRDACARAARGRRSAEADRARAAADRAAAAGDRRAARVELRHAHHDALTGALRREAGEAVLQQELERARRDGGLLSLAFVDVDGLKAVNDRHGHAAGDRLLRAVVEVMRRHLRSFDPIVRFGGDEFVCVMVGTGEAGARRRFEVVEAALARGHAGAAISVGIAQLRHGEDLAGVLARGDAALYAARRGRRHAEPGAVVPADA
jgi:diguanylate cyclase (GGDEF)-like protein